MTTVATAAIVTFAFAKAKVVMMVAARV